MDFKWNYLLADGRDARFICFKCFEGRGSMINAQFAFRASSFVIGQFSINETKSIGFVCIVVEKRGGKGLRYKYPPLLDVAKKYIAAPRFQFNCRSAEKLGSSSCVLLFSTYFDHAISTFLLRHSPKRLAEKGYSHKRYIVTSAKMIIHLFNKNMAY